MTLLAAAAAAASLLPAGCRPVRQGADEFRPRDAPPLVVTPMDVAARRIRGPELDRAASFLGSDDLWSPRNDVGGASRAAAWIAERFQLQGLVPAGEDGGYIQYRPGPVRDDAPAAGGTADAGGGSGPPHVPPEAPNVVALLPGSDLTLAREPVVLVARFDSAGEAPAVATLVGVADALAALPTPPRRPIVLLAVTGPGDAWFAAHPTVPLDRAAAVVALAVPAAAGDTVPVWGPAAGRAAPLLRCLAPSTGDRGLTVRARTGTAGRAGVAPEALARSGVPVVAVGVGPIHDDPDRAARVARLVFLAADRLASADQRPGTGNWMTDSCPSASTAATPKR